MQKLIEIINDFTGEYIQGHRDNKVSYFIRPGLSNFTSQISLINIALRVCEICEVTIDQLKGKCRERKYVDCRKIYSSIARCIINEENYQIRYTFNDIGCIIRKDHATIMDHIKKAEYLLETDQQFRQLYSKCKNNVFKNI